MIDALPLFQCFMGAAGNAVSTLALHTAGQPHLSATCCSSVVLLSLGTSRSLCVFFLASFLGLVLYIQTCAGPQHFHALWNV